jgi:zinc/manganese transport system substrate-binding protein
MRRWLAGLILMLVVFPAAAEPIRVVASFSILADLTRAVGGEAVEVTSIVGPGGDAHVYQPTPADAGRIADASLLIVNGLGLDDWMRRLAEAAHYRGKIIVASAGITPLLTGGEPDPHQWQDVANARAYAASIAAALEAADPDQADLYRRRAVAYDSALADLDRDVRAAIDTVPTSQRRVITSHDAFAYYGRAYGVTFLAPVGMDEESEPSAAAVAALIRQIRTAGTRALFVENMTDPRLIQRLAEEAGASIGGTLFADALSPAGQGGDTYVTMMRHNTEALVRAMRGN